MYFSGRYRVSCFFLHRLSYFSDNLVVVFHYRDESTETWKASLTDINNWSTTRIIRVESVINLFDIDTQARILAAAPRLNNVNVPEVSLAQTIPTRSPPPKIPLFRLYSPGARDHFYTTSVSECDNAVKTCHYTFEGIAGLVFPGQVESTVPLYRVWGKLDHFYTTNSAEKSRSLASYTDEGIACYLYSGPSNGTVPLYRLWNSGQHDHLYTADAEERNKAIRNGWVDEGIAGYLYAI